MTIHRIPFRTGAVALAAATLAACGGGSGDPIEISVKPSYITGFIDEKAYDGAGDDLLTAGLGVAGLASATAPAVSATPTAAELRRLAIWTNYRAIVDVSANGGYGRLFGPNVPPDGTAAIGDGRIAGTEYITYADDGSGTQNVTLMIQVPASFDPARPCIVTGTSSGSRGVYGAIGSSGEWGLKRGCAVAYADKGTGNGVHDLQADTVNLIDGTRTAAANAGKASNFTARLTNAERAAFNTATPNRVAVKHAHSEQNPEKDWGRDTLRAVEFAFWVVNERYSPNLPNGRERRINPANTIVIASSVSNGGGAALAAAEIDRAGLIDGVAVSEPQVQLQTLPTGTLRIQRGSLPPLPVSSRPLVDYVTYANLLQPCAALAVAGAPGAAFVNAALAANRCAALAANRLVSGTSPTEQAADALNRLLTYGWEAESNPLHASHYAFATPAIATTYTNSYGRFRVTDNLCGYSIGFFVATDPTQTPAAVPAATLSTIFATGNGVPPGAGLQLINNASVGGPRGHTVGVSASTGLADFSFDNAICQRDLFLGTSANAGRVRTGVQEVLRNANLGGKPAIIVHGRADALVPTNFSSRPYFARNQQVEGTGSRLRYIEVTNAQHFDSFLNPTNFLAGYDTRYVPLHVYFNRAMDAMWAHLTAGAPLPDSQVVRTTPRGGTAGAAPALTAANVPPIAATATGADAIRLVNGDTLFVPD